jgi:hypothetical protein
VRAHTAALAAARGHLAQLARDVEAAASLVDEPVALTARGLARAMLHGSEVDGLPFELLASHDLPTRTLRALWSQAGDQLVQAGTLGDDDLLAGVDAAECAVYRLLLARTRVVAGVSL